MTDSRTAFTDVADLTAEQRQLLELKLRKSARATDEPLPLSFTQEQLWFLDRLDPGNPAYTIPFGLRLTGPLNVTKLARAIDDVVARHPALRTTFVEQDGELRQRVSDRLSIPLPVTDLTGLAVGERDKAVAQVVAEHTRQMFDLSTGPLLAVRLVVLDPRNHLLLVTAHHIVFDAASADIFGRDLAARYDEQTLPELTTSFGRYAAAQRRRLTGPVLDEHLDYWRDTLAGCPTRSTLPPDRPRPPVQTHRGGRRAFTVPAELTAALAERARRTGVTLNALVLAGFGALLRQATGQEQMLLGMPVAGRPRTELESVIGSFANMLVLRIDIPGADTVGAVFRRVHQAISEAYAHQDAPYARVVEALDPPRDPSQNALFQAMVSITDAPTTRWQAGEVEFRPFEVDNGLTDFDLFVLLSQVDGELRGNVGYNADLYLGETIEQLTDRFLAVLDAIAAEPDRVVRDVPAMRRHRVAVAASFTADPVRAPMDLLTGVLRFPVELELAPYNQIVQHLLHGGDGRLAEVVLLRWEDWLRHTDPTCQALDRAWHDLETAIETYRLRCSVPLLIVVCPASPRFADPRWARVFGRLDDRLAELADRTDGVHPVWFADWAQHYPVGTVFDEQTDKLGHVPYTPEMFAALAIVLTRQLHALCSDPAGWPEPADLAVPVALAERAAPARHVITASDTLPVPPRTETERRLAGVWQRLLNLDEVGVTHDFFALGGHSLLATQLLSRVHAELGADISLHTLFRHPTIEALAALIDESSQATTHPLVPVPRDSDLGLSTIQQRLWAVGQLDGDPTRHNTTFAVVLRGELDAEALRRALADVVDRHEILRTTFTERDGRPVMVVSDAADSWLACWLDVVDLSAEPTNHAAAIDRVIGEHATHHYDLEAGPLLRVQLVRTSAVEHYLVLGMHHIICDNTSWGVLLGELSAGYTAQVSGQRPNLPALPVQFADYAAWQHDLLTEQALRPHVAYWRNRLRDAPAPLAAPPNRPRRTQNEWARTERVASRVPATVSVALRELARGEGSTPFNALLAAYAVLLYRRSAQPDVVLSVPQAGRPHPELENLIGCFTDLLPVRVDLAGRPTFRQVLQRMHRAVVDGYQHLDVPFSGLVDALALSRPGARHPVFQCAFNVADLPDEALHWPGLELVPVDVPVTGLDFDLFLTLTSEGGGLAATLEYSADLFDPSAAEELLTQFVTQLAELAGHPDEPITLPAAAADAADTADIAADAAQPGWPVRIASSFPVEPALPVLSWWAERLGLPMRAQCLPSGQVLRPLLQPSAGLGEPGRGVNALLIRWQDLLPTDASMGAIGELELQLVQLCRAVDRWHARSGAPLAVVIGCPSEPFAQAPWTGVFGHATDRLRRFARRYPGVSVLDTAADLDLAADFAADEGEAALVLGTALARLLHRHAAQPVPTVLLDPTRFPWPERLAGFARAQRRAGRRVLLTADAPEVLALSGAEVRTPAELSAAELEGAVAVHPAPALRVRFPQLRTLPLPADPAALNHLWVLDEPPAAAGDGYVMPAELVSEIAERLRTTAAVRAAISELPADPDGSRESQAPRTEREQALATIWREVLKLPEVGMHDDFFEIGGDSMTAIQVVWLANQQDIKITPKQLAAHPTIAELCGADPEPAAVAAEQSHVVGAFPPPGAQLWFFETLAPTMTAPGHFNHPYYLRLRRPVPICHLKQAVAVLAGHHDALRLRWRRTAAGWEATHAAPDVAVPFVSHDVSGVPAADREQAIEDILNREHLGLDIESGPLARFVHLGLGGIEPDRVLIICHHLVTDGVSRTLLLEDFQTVLVALGSGQRPALPRKTTSYRDWARRLDEYTRGERLLRELPFWLAQAPGAEQLPVDLPGVNRFGVMDSIGTTLDAEVTGRLRAVAKQHQVGMNDLLVWAAVRLAADWTGSAEWTIATTGHGREALFDDVDLSRTVGWFQVLYPVRLRLPDQVSDAAAVVTLAEQLGRVPTNGIGYGLLRYAHPDPAVRQQLSTAHPQLTVNYTGAFGFDDISAADELFDLCTGPLGVVQDPGCVWPGRLDFVGSLIGSTAGDRLHIDMNFGTEMYQTTTAELLLGEFERLLQRLAVSALPATQKG